MTEDKQIIKEQLKALRKEILACTACSLRKGARRPVPGIGSREAKIFFVGEAPGADEDRAGEPFVGKAGGYLNDALEANDITRTDVRISNCVKCRPPDNRTPTPEEIKTCKHFLDREIEIINPEIVVPMGNTALKATLGREGITKERGKLIRSKNGKLRLFPTFHPSAVNYDPTKKQTITDDIKAVKDFIEHRSGVEILKERLKYKVVDSPEKLENLYHRLKQSKIVAFDTETNSVCTPFQLGQNARLATIAFSYADCRAAVIPYQHVEAPDGSWGSSVRSFLRDVFLKLPDIKLVAHNAKFDTHWMEGYLCEGGERIVPWACTMLMHHLLSEEESHGLKNLCWSYTNYGGYDNELDDWKAQHKIIYADLENPTGIGYAAIPMSVLGFYNAADALACRELYFKFEKDIKKEDLWTYFRGLVMPAMRPLMEMEQRGILIDIDQLDRLGAESGEHSIPQRLRDLEKKLRKLTGVDKEFNFGSSDQKRWLIYKKLKFPKPIDKIDKESGRIIYMRGKTGFSADKAALLAIISQNKKDLDKRQLAILENLLEYSGASYLWSRGIKGIRKFICPDNRVRGSYFQAGTKTGRLAARDPNMQNWPRTTTEFGKLAKSIFIPTPGYEFYEDDYSQLELKIAAMASGDKAMINAFRKGRDIHLQSALSIADMSYEDLRKIIKNEKHPQYDKYSRIRTLAKTTNFSVFYGAGIAKIAATAKVGEEFAKNFLRAWFRQYSGLREYIEDTKHEASRKGYVTTLFGRNRHLPGIWSEDKSIKARAERQAVNSIIQGTAVDCSFLSLILVADYFKATSVDASILVQVHDNKLCEIRKEVFMEVARDIRELSEDLPLPWDTRGIKLAVDPKRGLRWSELISFDPDLKEIAW